MKLVHVSMYCVIIIIMLSVNQMQSYTHLLFFVQTNVIRAGYCYSLYNARLNKRTILYITIY